MSRAGPLAAFGEATRKALVLWHEQVLAGADASDPPIFLEFVDDESKPDVAAERFAEMARRVHVAVGPYGSQLTAAILPVCREAGLPVLLPSAGVPGLQLQGDEGAPPIGFSLLPPNTESLTGAVDWAASQGIRDVALLFRGDPFSQQAAQGVRRRAGELNLSIAWDRTYSTAAEIWQVAMELEGGIPGTSDTWGNSSAPRGKVGLLLGGGYTPGAEAGGFLPDAREIAIAFEDKAVWKALLVAPTFPEFRQALGARAEGILGNTNWKSWFPWPGNAEFTAAYRLRWGEEPDNHAAAAYAAGQLIEAAWRRIQLEGGTGASPPAEEFESATPATAEILGSDAPSGEAELAVVRLALRQALAGLEMTSVFGPFAVDGKGRQKAHVNVLLQWQAGRLYPLNLNAPARE